MTKAEETAAWLQLRLPQRPKTAIVLGSGLGVFAECLEDPVEMSYADIPNWPQATAIGHAANRSSDVWAISKCCASAAGRTFMRATTRSR